MSFVNSSLIHLGLWSWLDLACQCLIMLVDFKDTSKFFLEGKSEGKDPSWSFGPVYLDGHAGILDCHCWKVIKGDPALCRGNHMPNPPALGGIVFGKSPASNSIGFIFGKLSFYFFFFSYYVKLSLSMISTYFTTIFLLPDAAKHISSPFCGSFFRWCTEMLRASYLWNTMPFSPPRSLD